MCSFPTLGEGIELFFISWVNETKNQHQFLLIIEGLKLSSTSILPPTAVDNNITDKIEFFIFKFLKEDCNKLTSFISALISGTLCITAQLFNPHFLRIDNVNPRWTLPFQIFSANNNRWSAVKHPIDPPITAVALRFHPTAWSGDMCMRVEAYGCDGECKIRERDRMGSWKAREVRVVWNVRTISRNWKSAARRLEPVSKEHEHGVGGGMENDIIK